MSINPLKEFFKRKKAEAKFARAGPGKTLSSEASTSREQAPARQAAAEAAMKRFNREGNKPSQRPRMAEQLGQPTSSSEEPKNQMVTQSTGISTESRKELPVIDGVVQRNVQVYTSDELAQKMKTPEIDDDFFRLTVDDVKLIQQRYDEEKARTDILKTREMRRREAEARTPTTNVARLRFKLPNNFVLEASFSGSETMAAIRDWLVTTCLRSMELDLKSYDILLGFKPIKESENDKSVRQLGLIPATTLTVVLKNV